MRPSRLVSSITRYLQRSSSIIIRSIMTYDPLRFFLTPAVALLTATLILGLRYLYFFFLGEGVGHIQGLILALAFFILGTAFLIVGLLSDLIAVNRQILEEVAYRLRNLESQQTAHLSQSSEHAIVFNRAYLTYKRK